jgi:hypothetical protein
MHDVKEALYSVIDEIGRERIRAEVSKNADASKKYCEEIVEKCTSVFGNEADDGTLGTLCEALAHFMLTASLLPSERKVSVNGTEIDIVIPSVKNLVKTPDKALVIQFIKGRGELAKIKQAKATQNHFENIWIVSAGKVEYDGRNYTLEDNKFKYSSLISDIRAFLSSKGVTSLKMLHG